MGELTYEDFKSRISIKTLLEDAGYHFYRKDGLKYPAFVRLDSQGQRIHGDKFIITANGYCCFRPPEQRNYNVISFIKEHPGLFAEYTPGMDKDRLVNLVCNRLLGYIADDTYHQPVEPKPIKPFDISHYEVQPYDVSNFDIRKRFYPYFRQRGLDMKTQADFAGNFFLATALGRKEGKRYTNLAFPFRIPGDGRIVGLEERGRQQEGMPHYKGKAAGTNSVEGLWMANIGEPSLQGARRVLWFESAFDAMAFYQIHRKNYEDTRGIYVSTGGNPTEKQFKGVIGTCPDADHHLCFDRDRAGELFACSFVATKAGKDYQLYTMEDGTIACTDNREAGHKPHLIPAAEFSYEEFCRGMGLSQLQITYHPCQAGYKDWNDQLLDKPMVETDEKQQSSLHR